MDAHAGEKCHLGTEHLLKLVYEAALANARLANNIDHLGLAALSPFERCLKAFHLRTAADELCHPPHKTSFEPRARTRSLRDRTVDGLWFGLALQRYLAHGLMLNIVMDNSAGVLTHPNFAWPCGLLNAGSQIGRVTDGRIIHS